MSNVLDSRPSDLTARWGTGVDVEITATVLAPDGTPLEGPVPAIYLGGPANAVEPLDDADADFTGTGGTDGVWTIAVPGQTAGSHRLRVTLDDEVVAVGFAEVGALGSRAPTTALTIAGGSATLALSVAAVVNTGGGAAEIAVEDDGVEIVDAVATLNFTGAGVSVTDEGGGAVEVAIPGGSGLALGETDTTAYRGDRGKTAYDHSQVVSGNPHSVTAAQTGADPAGTAASAVSTHAGAVDPHGDRAYTDSEIGALTPGDIGAQPVDSDLTAIAALTTTAFGRGLLELANAGAALTALGAVPTTRTLAGLDLSADRTASALRTALGTGTADATTYLRGYGTWAAAGSAPQLPRTSGVYYGLSGGEANSQTIGGTNVAGRLVAHPVWLAAGNYDRIAVYVGTTGTATWRLGVYPASGSTLQADGQTLILDCGTINMSTATGLRELTVSLTIPTTGIYWLALLVDAWASSPAVTGWNGTAGATPNLPWSGHTAFGSVAGRGSWTRSVAGVTTGAMPATFPAASGSDQIPQILVRAS